MGKKTARAGNRTASDRIGDDRIDIVERGIRQWRTARPDIDCSGKAVVGRILRLQGVVLKHVDAALKPFGLKYPAYAVLATLRVGAEDRGMSPGALTRTLLLSSGGISNLLARLERQGHIERIHSERDRRGVIVRLTETGRALADDAMIAHANAERAFIAVFVKEDEKTLGNLLERLLLSHEGADEPPDLR